MAKSSSWCKSLNKLIELEYSLLTTPFNSNNFFLTLGKTPNDFFNTF